MTALACEGSAEALTTTPVVGSPGPAPAAEQVGPGELRVTILGSGDPFVRPSQASASVLVEVGNAAMAGVPAASAEAVVNGVHTSPVMAGKGFAAVGARMSVRWHLAVDHETVGSAYREMRGA